MMQLWFYKVDKAAAGFLFSSSVEAEGFQGTVSPHDDDDGLAEPMISN